LDEVSVFPPILSGVLLGVDFGLKRVGLAVCDPEGRVAVAGGRIEDASGKSLAKRILAAALERNASGIVLGEPPLTRGNELVIEGAHRLGRQIEGAGLKVAFWPEHYSTASAHAARKHFGGKASGDKSWADEAAAVIILQDYLDWRRSKLERDK
jgi:putative holliday junction resolvase